MKPKHFLSMVGMHFAYVYLSGTKILEGLSSCKEEIPNSNISRDD